LSSAAETGEEQSLFPPARGAGCDLDRDRDCRLAASITRRARVDSATHVIEQGSRVSLTTQ